MRIANWNAAGVMAQIGQLAEENANSVMDDVVEKARAACPIGTITREGKWSGQRAVSFTPRTGKNKGKRISFIAQRVWLGRQPGDLRSTIRRVNKAGSGSIRVIAGQYKIFWAHLVERGSVHWPAHPFLRPAFQAIKGDVLRRIKNGA